MRSAGLYTKRYEDMNFYLLMVKSKINKNSYLHTTVQYPSCISNSFSAQITAYASPKEEPYRPVWV